MRVCLSAGLLMLDDQTVSSSVSAYLYSVRESKLGRTHPHQFNEQLLFESSGEQVSSSASPVYFQCLCGLWCCFDCQFESSWSQWLLTPVVRSLLIVAATIEPNRPDIDAACIDSSMKQSGSVLSLMLTWSLCGLCQFRSSQLDLKHCWNVCRMINPAWAWSCVLMAYADLH